MAGLKELATGKRDLFMVDPRVIQIRKDWNVRENTDELQLHLNWLKESIKQVGVQQPIIIYMDDGKPFVADGHCRLKATLLAIKEGADIKTIPCLPEDRYASDGDRMVSMITRNSGKSLTALEQGEVYKRLVRFGWHPNDIATKVGMSVSHIANMLKLAGADGEVHDMVRQGTVSPSLAVKAIKKDPSKAKAVLKEAVDKAKKSGKKKATDKHVASTKPSLKRLAEVAWIFISGLPDSQKKGEAFERLTDLLEQIDTK